MSTLIPVTPPICTRALQKSLQWCEGAPVLPGMRRRLYYISKSEIVSWPILTLDHNRPVNAAYSGSFTLKADAKWKFIDILPDKSQLTSEPQGELPSQTQLNKLTAVHPGVGPEASAAAGYLNNTDSVFLIQDMNDYWRVVGSDKWMSKITVQQDIGQGPTGTASTTISVEATDVLPAPFYSGVIETEEGELLINKKPLTGTEPTEEEPEE